MTAKADTTRRVYYSTSSRPLPLEGDGTPLKIGERVTFTGEPYGSAIAHIETGALRLAPDDEQPGYKPSPKPKTTTDQGA